MEGGVSDRVGTCGWVYRDWRGTVYGRGVRDELAAYSSMLSAVEIDATFYRLPSVATTASWAARVPDGFRFAAKMSRFLTHVRRLQEPQGPVDLLMERLAPLGTALEVIVLQLPPTMRVALDRLDDTLGRLARARPGLTVAVEPREPSWFVDETRAVLQAHGAVLAWTDRHSCRWVTAATGYVRFHDGLAGGRRGRAWADRIAEAWPGGAWAVFNNDPGGAAVRDAMRLRGLLARRRGR